MTRSSDPLDEVGDYGDVAKADFPEIWMRVCCDELAAAAERRRLEEAIARHPANKPEETT